MGKVNKIVSDKDYRIALSLILFILFLKAALAILSDGTYGGEDDISHYRIARYAYRFPEQFFDLWGKPVFTTLASPFAQFGFNGIRIFNVLTSSATSWLAFLIVRRLRVSNPWSVIILISFAPIFMVMSYTGMTEIVFSFMVVLSIWLLITDRYRSAVIILSMLPFARSEGFVLWFPVIAALILKRKFGLLPLFCSGFVILSLAGYLFYNDLLWIVHQFPYRGGADIYGSGSLFHFVKAIPGTFGIPLALLTLIGIVSLWIKQPDKNSERSFIFLWYIFLPAICYFSAHSFVWWRGMGNSVGLVRVMTGIIPLAALIGSLGIEYINVFFNKMRIPVIPAVGVLLLFFTVNGFTRHQHPTRLTEEQLLVKEATDWIASSQLSERKVYYYNPFYFYFRRIDPYDQSKSKEKVTDLNDPGLKVAPGEIVMWDSHFSPNEGELSESVLLDNRYFRFVTSFGNETAGSAIPRVAIYERLPDNYLPVDSGLISPGRDLSGTISDTVVIPFSHFIGIKPENILLIHNKKLYQVKNGIEFSPSFQLKISDLPQSGQNTISVEASLVTSIEFEHDEILLIASIERRGKPYIYLKQDFFESNSDDYGYRCKIELAIPSDARRVDMLSVYIWNKEKKEFFITDLKLTLHTKK